MPATGVCTPKGARPISASKATKSTIALWGAMWPAKAPGLNTWSRRGCIMKPTTSNSSTTSSTIPEGRGWESMAATTFCWRTTRSTTWAPLATPSKWCLGCARVMATPVPPPVVVQIWHSMAGVLRRLVAMANQSLTATCLFTTTSSTTRQTCRANGNISRFMGHAHRMPGRTSPAPVPPTPTCKSKATSSGMGRPICRWGWVTTKGVCPATRLATRHNCWPTIGSIRCNQNSPTQAMGIIGQR